MRYMLWCCFDESSWEKLSDGPFAETKEQFGGYHLIECQDLDEVIGIAGRIPTLPAEGGIEVRPVSVTELHHAVR